MFFLTYSEAIDKKIKERESNLNNCKYNEQLDHYIKISELIVNHESFKDSNSKSIEDIIVKLSRESPTIEQADYHTFVTLFGSSLIGKTQLAFTFRNIKPIYFSMHDDNSIKMPIYVAFKSISNTMKKHIKSDFEAIRSRFKDLQTNCIGEFESIKEISDVKFNSLGYISALINDSKKRFNAEKDVWMQFHADRPELKRFNPCSVNEFIASDFEGYCVFIDDFAYNNESILLRNLIKSTGMTCVVAAKYLSVPDLPPKTNSYLANRIWSKVCLCFDRANYEIFNEEFNISDAISLISRNLNKKTRIAFKEFIDHVLEKQFNHLRPGVALLLCSVLENAPKVLKDSYRMVDVLNYLFSTFSKEFIKIFRNIQTIDTHEMIANFCLNSTFPYWSEFKEDKFCNGNYAYFHLYEIIGPNELVTDWTNLYRSSKWTYWTYFRAEEHLAIMAFLFSTTGIDPNNFKSIVYWPCCRFNLRMYASMSIIESSHFKVEAANVIACTLEGISLKDLLANLIKYFVQEAKNSILEFTKISGFDLENYCTKEVHVPFLNAVNMLWPDIYSKLDDDSIKLGFFNNSGKFDILYKNEPASAHLQCEDIKKHSSLKFKTLLENLKNSKGSKVVFVFCRILSYGSEEEISELRNYTEKEEINIFTYNQQCKTKYAIDLLRSDYKVHSNPKMVAFVFPGIVKSPGTSDEVFLENIIKIDESVARNSDYY